MIDRSGAAQAAQEERLPAKGDWVVLAGFEMFAVIALVHGEEPMLRLRPLGRGYQVTELPLRELGGHTFCPERRTWTPPAQAVGR